MSKTIEAQSEVAENHRRLEGSHPRTCSFGSDRRCRGRRGRHVPATRCACLARMEADRTQQNRSQRPPVEAIQRREGRPPGFARREQSWDGATSVMPQLGCQIASLTRSNDAPAAKETRSACTNLARDRIRDNPDHGETGNPFPLND
jgi:hypothetical protein